MAAPALSMRQFDFVKLCIPGEVKALTALFRQIAQARLGAGTDQNIAFI